MTKQNQPRPTTDQSHQTVYGHQLNIAGNVGDNVQIQLPPIQPTAATAPAPPPDFVGRADHLAQLTTTLTAGKSAAITALQGMGGIGKTALAQMLAQELKPDFPGGIFWADLVLHNGSAEPILRQWGAVCGADLSQEPDPNVLAGRVRGLLERRRSQDGPILAVVDDVRSEPEAWDGRGALAERVPARGNAFAVDNA